MNYNTLLYVITVGKYKSFTKAANHLFISQSALSQNIIRLEENLGIKLFNRTKNYVELTDAGKLFIEQAKIIVEKMDILEKSMMEYSTKKFDEITVGISQFYGKYFLTYFIQVIRDAYPDIKIDIEEKESSILEKYMLEGKVDLALIPMPVSSKDIYYEKIYKENILLAINKSLFENKYLKKKSDKLTLTDFKDSDFIMLKSGLKFRNISEKICIEEYGFRPKVIFESENLDILNELVSKNIGLTFLPEQITRLDNVIYLDIESKYSSRDLVLASEKSNFKKFNVEKLSNILYRTILLHSN